MNNNGFIDTETGDNRSESFEAVNASASSLHEIEAQDVNTTGTAAAAAAGTAAGTAAAVSSDARGRGSSTSFRNFVNNSVFSREKKSEKVLEPNEKLDVSNAEVLEPTKDEENEQYKTDQVSGDNQHESGQNEDMRRNMTQKCGERKTNNEESVEVGNSERRQDSRNNVAKLRNYLNNLNTSKEINSSKSKNQSDVSLDFVQENVNCEIGEETANENKGQISQVSGSSSKINTPQHNKNTNRFARFPNLNILLNKYVSKHNMEDKHDDGEPKIDENIEQILAGQIEEVEQSNRKGKVTSLKSFFGYERRTNMITKERNLVGESTSTVDNTDQSVDEEVEPVTDQNPSTINGSRWMSTIGGKIWLSKKNQVPDPNPKRDLDQRTRHNQDLDSNSDQRPCQEPDQDVDEGRSALSRQASKVSAWGSTIRDVLLRTTGRHTTEVGQVVEYGDSGVNTERMCGVFGRYPACLQKFATPQRFLAVFCLQNILNGATASLLIGSATSIEKHFHFSSKDIGSIITFSEIGPMVFSLMLSHMGSLGNRPRWMALGALMSMAGLLLACCNYVFFPPPEMITDASLSGGVGNLCRYQDLLSEVVVPLQRTSSFRSDDGSEECVNHSQSAYFAWLVVYTLIGVGNMLVYTLGAPYLDDSIQKKDSPMYFAISMSMRIIGPLLGFSMTAALLRVYVHPSQHAEVVRAGGSPADPRWVGAWWIGCLALALLYSLAATITAFFPRTMKREAPTRTLQAVEAAATSASTASVATTFETEGVEVVGEDEEENGDEKDRKVIKGGKNNKRNERGELEKEEKKNGNNERKKLSAEFKTFKESLKGFRLVCSRLLHNRLVTYSIIGDFFSASAAFGFYLWMPKFFEHQFRVDKSTSSLYTGISGLSSIVLGVIGGAIYIKRCQPTARTLCGIMLVCRLVHIVSLASLSTIHCDYNEDLPGILDMDQRGLELNRGCSGGCSCTGEEFAPVCVSDGLLKLTFFSPCHAGCYIPPIIPSGPEPILIGGPQQSEPPEQEYSGPLTYTNCSCGSTSATVRSGYCRETCGGFTLYTLVTVTVNSFVSVGAIGGLLIYLRCVPPEDKAAALGLKSTVVSLAILVNPLVFGALADSACLVWEEVCQETGSCWVYNAQDLGYKIHIGAVLLFIAAAIFDVLVYRNVNDLQLFDEDLQGSGSSRTLSSTMSSFFVSRLPQGFPKHPPSLVKTFRRISRNLHFGPNRMDISRDGKDGEGTKVDDIYEDKENASELVVNDRISGAVSNRNTNDAVSDIGSSIDTKNIAVAELGTNDIAIAVVSTTLSTNENLNNDYEERKSSIENSGLDDKVTQQYSVDMKTNSTQDTESDNYHNEHEAYTRIPIKQPRLKAVKVNEQNEVINKRKNVNLVANANKTKYNAAGRFEGKDADVVTKNNGPTRRKNATGSRTSVSEIGNNGTENQNTSLTIENASSATGRHWDSKEGVSDL